MREEKGNSIIAFPCDYTVIDIETTGLSPEYDSIIELSAIKVRNNVTDEVFSEIVKAYEGIQIDSFITSLTGITQTMVNEASDLDKVLKEYLTFIGEDIIIGHNVNFDINFIYDAAVRLYGAPLQNDFVDTMRISRKLFNQERHHRLSDIAERFQIRYDGAHRALNDCTITKDAYEKMKCMIENAGGIECFINMFGKNRKKHEHAKYSHISVDEIAPDEDNILFGKTCVITGTLERFSRNEALAAIERIGGLVGANVTKKTNILILGNNDYCSSIKDGKSGKQKKAETYKLQGQDIEIISEGVFYEILQGK